MKNKRVKIGTFPVDTNDSKKNDVLYLGGLKRNLGNSEVGKLLLNDYVFLFSTKLDISKDSDVYGQVSIDLVRHEHLSDFNYDLRDKVNYHLVEKEPLFINDFLEVIPEETERGIHIFAHLKSQSKINFMGKSTKSYRILLMRTNNSRFANLPTWELGPEFQAKLELDKASEHLNRLLNCSSLLSNLDNRNKGNSTKENAFEIVIDSLNKEIERAKMENDSALNNYLAYRRSLEYIHKE